MNTTILSANSPDIYRKAFDVLKQGGLIAFPTDTVYGIGAMAFDGVAVESIYQAKDRPIEKAIPVLIAEIMDLDKVTRKVPPINLKLASRFWPGPLTVLFPKEPTLPESVSATETVGVRIPDHALTRLLLRHTGPLAVTSANISGKDSPTTADEVFSQLKGRIPLIIDGGKTRGGVPSTLVDCTGGEITILREGPITLQELLSAI